MCSEWKISIYVETRRAKESIGLPNYVVKDCGRRQKELSWTSWNKHVARGSLKESWIRVHSGHRLSGLKRTGTMRGINYESQLAKIKKDVLHMSLTYDL